MGKQKRNRNKIANLWGKGVGDLQPCVMFGACWASSKFCCISLEKTKSKKTKSQDCRPQGEALANWCFVHRICGLGMLRGLDLLLALGAVLLVPSLTPLSRRFVSSVSISFLKPGEASQLPPKLVSICQPVLSQSSFRGASSAKGGCTAKTSPEKMWAWQTSQTQSVKLSPSWKRV